MRNFFRTFPHGGRVLDKSELAVFDRVLLGAWMILVSWLVVLVVAELLGFTGGKP